MRSLTFSALALALTSTLSAAETPAAKPAPAAKAEPVVQAELSKSFQEKLMTSLARGAAYLHAQQKPDGSWENDLGVTGMVATALIQAPGDIPAKYQADIDKALAWLAGKVQEDGGIYLKDNQNYFTAVAMQAFAASGKKEYKPLVEKAQKYLLSLQADEARDYDPEDKFYGGIGYGSELRPDIAVMERTLAALKDSGLPADNPAWAKALKFLQRSQNRSESNDQEWAGNDGGFVYFPGYSYAGETRSYGSVTYAGLMSYSYASLKKDDPRVQGALKWIREHYSVDENPGLGHKALYYYYFVFAKALDAYDETIIEDASGMKHNWRVDLGQKLLDEQGEDGTWLNLKEPSWMGDNKVMMTTFALHALEHILAD